MNRRVWENTESAFARAIESGFTIECDLQLSADGRAIVFHDHETQRLCNVAGTVRQMSIKALTSMHVGGTADRIQTLTQFLQQVNGSVGVVLELKVRDPDEIAEFAKTVLADLENYTGNAALMSFNASLVKVLIDAGVKWPIGLVAAEYSSQDKADNRKALALPLDFISFRVDHLPSQFVSDARAQGLPVITWTVKDNSGRQATARFADQMTFEGFDPRALSA